MARLIAARRTAVVPRGGAFARLSIEDLAAPVVLACLADAGLSPNQVDELILSNALGAGGNPARRVALASGLPERVAGLSIDRQCAGGLDAILLARALVDSGAAEIVLAGGVESYSRRPLRWATDPDGGPPVPYDQAPFTPWPDRDPDMAAAADALARRLGISRERQEAWATESHAKALRADHSVEIVPLAGISRDTFPRALTSRLLGARAGCCWQYHRSHCGGCGGCGGGLPRGLGPGSGGAGSGDPGRRDGRRRPGGAGPCPGRGHRTGLEG